MDDDEPSIKSGENSEVKISAPQVGKFKEPPIKLSESNEVRGSVPQIITTQPQLYRDPLPSPDSQLFPSFSGDSLQDLVSGRELAHPQRSMSAPQHLRPKGGLSWMKLPVHPRCLSSPQLLMESQNKAVAEESEPVHDSSSSPLIPMPKLAGEIVLVGGRVTWAPPTMLEIVRSPSHSSEQKTVTVESSVPVSPSAPVNSSLPVRTQDLGPPSVTSVSLMPPKPLLASQASTQATETSTLKNDQEECSDAVSSALSDDIRVIQGHALRGSKQKARGEQAKKELHYKMKLQASLIVNTKIKLELLEKERKLKFAEHEIVELKRIIRKMESDSLADYERVEGMVLGMGPLNDRHSWDEHIQTLSSPRKIVYWCKVSLHCVLHSECHFMRGSIVAYNS